MPRSIRGCPKRPENADPWRDYEKLECVVQVITPMFGGGVEPGVPDPVTLIRPTSIRGHLRSWWRATRGAAFSTTEGLKKRETEIWGDTENPSPVVAAVTVQPASLSKRTPGDDYGYARFGPEAYALFSARQNGASLVKEGIVFTLSLHWPKHGRLQAMRDSENERGRRAREKPLEPKINDIAQDVKAALWAWLSFGGLGARTRRGCGALQLLESEPALPKYSLDNSIIRVFLGPDCADALDAWNKAVGVYQEFRQGFRGRRHDKTLPNGRVLRKIPGRSHWPEPDSIRKLTGCALDRARGPSGGPEDVDTHNHGTPVVDANVLPAFPRAILGMPIIFHSADGPGKRQDGTPKPADPKLDPQDSEIVPQFPDVLDEKAKPSVGTRMASPVITRAVSWGGRWRPALIVLRTPARLDAKLRGRMAKYHQGRALDLDYDVPNGQVQDPRLRTLGPLQGKDNAVDGLVAFAKGFSEVTL